MKKTVKAMVMGTAVAGAALGGSAASAELSANIGLVSDYFFRGIDQESGATASAGLDWERNGLYAGTWLADVTDGIEYDLFGGYNGEAGAITYGVGFTGYYYTGEFDDTYQEVNLSVGYGPVSVSHNIGTYDSSPEQDYTFTSLTGEYKDLYATYGTFGNDFDGSYIEVGYGTEVGGFDTGVALISSDKDLSNQVDANGNPASDVSIVFSLGKAFDL